MEARMLTCTTASRCPRFVVGSQVRLTMRHQQLGPFGLSQWAAARERGSLLHESMSKENDMGNIPLLCLGRIACLWVSQRTSREDPETFSYHNIVFTFCSSSLSDFVAIHWALANGS